MKEVQGSDKKAITAITRALLSCKRVVVVFGAGVSTSPISGIPDFRSKHGLYNATKAGLAIFSASAYSSASTLLDHLQAMARLNEIASQADPSPTHAFVKHLSKRGMLLRAYTQNVDGLEGKAGLRYVDLAAASDASIGSEGSDGTRKRKRKRVEYDGDVVQLHGNVHSVRCTICSYSASWSADDSTAFKQGQVNDCPSCEQAAAERARLNKRSARRPSFLRPNVALYDEPHPYEATIGDIVETDLSHKPDCLLVMGTALKVHGARVLVKDMARAVKSRNGVTIRLDVLPSTREWDSTFDYHVRGTCDEATQAILREWKASRPQDWQVQRTLSGIVPSVKMHGAATAASKKQEGTPAKGMFRSENVVKAL